MLQIRINLYVKYQNVKGYNLKKKIPRISVDGGLLIRIQREKVSRSVRVRESGLEIGARGRIIGKKRSNKEYT